MLFLIFFFLKLKLQQNSLQLICKSIDFYCSFIDSCVAFSDQHLKMEKIKMRFNASSKLLLVYELMVYSWFLVSLEFYHLNLSVLESEKKILKRR